MCPGFDVRCHHSRIAYLIKSRSTTSFFLFYCLLLHMRTLLKHAVMHLYAAYIIKWPHSRRKKYLNFWFINFVSIHTFENNRVANVWNKSGHLNHKSINETVDNALRNTSTQAGRKLKKEGRQKNLFCCSTICFLAVSKRHVIINKR